MAWNLTGSTRLATVAPDATYWRRHLREPVRFADGLLQLHREGYTTFLEVGPHPTLLALAQRSLPEESSLLLTSLRRTKDDWHELMTSLAKLYVRGASVKFDGVDAPYGARLVAAPTYPFERRSFWVTPPQAGLRRVKRTSGRSNPLVGSRLPTAARIFELTLAPDSPAYLGEHRVHGAALVAGPVYMEMVQSCASEDPAVVSRAIEDFTIHEPLVLPDAGCTVQVELYGGPEAAHATSFTVHSRGADAAGAWRLHASGRLVEADAAPTAAYDHPALVGSAGESCTPFYARLAQLGIELGASFQSLRQVHRGDGCVVARITLPVERASDVVGWAHPVLLDGALQAVGLALPATDDSDVYLFTSAARVDVRFPLPPQLFCEVRLHDTENFRPSQWLADVVLRDVEGAYRGKITGICLRRSGREALSRAAGDDAAAGLFYRIDWEAVPTSVPAAGALEDPARIAAASRDRFASLADVHGLSVYDRLLPALDRISAGHVSRALRTLGFDSIPGRIFDLETEARSLHIAHRHNRLFARLVQMLVEDRVVEREGEVFKVIRTLPDIDPFEADDAASKVFGDVDGELSTLRRCGGALARVLIGEQDPLHLLFPGGSLVEARKLYVESPYAKTYNTALAEAVQTAISNLPAGARLRVLEIGAGTGGSTTYLLPALEHRRVEYTFTDLSPLFLERAAEQFAAYPFVRRALLDIERDPLSQGFEAGSYDIVIAANVLHATADLRRTLGHVRSLMASQGMLFLLEGAAPERWVDLTFGLTEGWWRFTDTTWRKDYPLVNRARWVDLLTLIGFTDASSIPSDRAVSRAESQQALIVARAPARTLRWTLLGTDDGVAAAMAERLRNRGDEVTCLPADVVDAHSLTADRIVYLGALPLAGRGGDDPAAADSCKTLACEIPLRLLAACARSESGSRVWLATNGALRVQESVSAGSRWQAPLWGLGRVFALEHPSYWGGLVDTAPDASDDGVAETLVAAIDGDDGEDQTAWRSGRRFAARLAPSTPPESATLQLRADATYLVTGGFGGLGLLVARWLAEHGATHIALLGRTPDAASAGVREIEALGARVWPLAGDVADELSMRRLLERLDADAPPLRGIVHAAADLTAAPILDLQAAQVSRMLRPKVDGTLVLERVTRGRDLDFQVLFSSTTALIGAAGFAHYAAANAFLDASASAANRSGRRVLSVNWGTWEAMRLASADSQRSFREGGLKPMPAAAALAALATALRGTDAQVVIASIDWSALKPLHEARRARPFLARLGLAPLRATSTVAGMSSLVERLKNAPQGSQHDLILSLVSTEVAVVLGLADGEAVPLETGLFELGMDSLMSVELRRRLERGVGQTLPSTLTFNYPTVSALTLFIDGQLRASTSATAPTAPVPIEAPTASPPGQDLDALSDDELEARLLARLEQMR